MTDAMPPSGAGSPRDDWPFSRVDGSVRRQAEIPLPNSAFAHPAAADRAAGAVEPAALESAPTAAGAAEDGLDPARSAPPEQAPTKPRARRPWVAVAVAVVAVAVVGGAIVLSGVLEGDPVAAPAPSIITVASPTPTLEAVAREPQTAFVDALPSTVLQYALTGVTAGPALTAAGALEVHQLGYSDGGAATVTLLAAQFETPSAAAAAAGSLLGVADPAATPQTGAVEVAGQPAGTWTVTTAPDGAGVAVWTNGTAVFQAVGPADAVLDFYTAYPL